MKNKYVIHCLLGIILACGELAHAHSRNDSIRTFLMELGEREEYIIPIVENSEFSFDSVYHIYIREHKILRLNKSRNEMMKVYSSSSSPFSNHSMDYNLGYFKNHMTEDKNGELLWFCTTLVMQGIPHDSVIDIAKYYWYHHHIPHALVHELCYWTMWKYEHNVDMPHSEAAFLYYSMAAYVISQGKNYRDFYCYYGLNIKLRYRKLYAGKMIPCDKKWTRNFLEEHKSLSQVMENNYYYQFRNIHLCDNKREPFFLTEQKREMIRDILDKGIEANERECIITKAFALITGTCLERDLERGKQLLVSIWPQMENSSFWEYVYSLDYGGLASIN